MATESLEDIVKVLSNLKVLEIAKLKNLLEQEWGVTAAAPMAATAAAAGPAAAAAPVEESTEFQVTVLEVPADKRIGAIKVIRELTGLSLKDAKDIVTETPRVAKERMPKAEAEDMVKKLEAAGAKVAMKGV